MHRIAGWAVLFEGGLAIAALALGWALDTDPFADWGWRWPAAAIGLVATLPPLGAMWWIDHSTWPPFRRLRWEVDRTLRPLFTSCSTMDVLVIGLAAGIGEELFFRGVVQTAIGSATVPLAGLAGASVLFGLMHLVTPTYAVLAGVMGAYLGWLLLATGNLLVPIVAHAAYDVAALVWWLRQPPGALAEDVTA